MQAMNVRMKKARLDLIVSRSVGKILHDIWVAKRSEESGSIVTIICPHGSESVEGRVGQILIVNA